MLAILASIAGVHSRMRLHSLSLLLSSSASSPRIFPCSAYLRTWSVGAPLERFSMPYSYGHSLDSVTEMRWDGEY